MRLIFFLFFYSLFFSLFFLLWLLYIVFYLVMIRCCCVHARSSSSFDFISIFLVYTRASIAGSIFFNIWNTRCFRYFSVLFQLFFFLLIIICCHSINHHHHHHLCFSHIHNTLRYNYI